jgi:hypothetical protein
MSRTGRAHLVAAVAAALACGKTGSDGEGSHVANDDAALADGVREGDPLLARARQSIKDGTIDPAIVEQILASEDPAHARARRLLRAMAREAGGGEGKAADAAGRPRLEVPEAGAGDGIAASPIDGSTSTAETETVEATDDPPVRRHRAVLRRISLRERKGGMTLTLHASEGVLVGTAHQRQSGTLRLVVESVGAEPRLLRSRPSRGQVEVTDIRRGQDTVIITVRVPPGWRVGKTRRFNGGARIDLVAP